MDNKKNKNNKNNQLDKVFNPLLKYKYRSKIKKAQEEFDKFIDENS